MWSYVQYRRIGKHATEEIRKTSRMASDHSSHAVEDLLAVARGRAPLSGGLSALPLEGGRSSANREQHDRRKKSSNKITVRISGEDDPLDPRNWSLLSRCKNIAILSLLIFVQAWAGAAGSIANTAASQEFHVGKVAENLSTAMYLFGIGSGSLFVGPLAETVGRNPTYLVATFVYLLFVLGSALTPTFGGQVFCRYCVGLFSSATLAINGSSVRDQFRPVKRAFVFPVIAWANVAGTGHLSRFFFGFTNICSGYSSCYITYRRWLDIIKQPAGLALDRVGNINHLQRSVPYCALVFTGNLSSNSSRLESKAPSPCDWRFTIRFGAL
ncbi:hypothetical protein GMDG_03091 [Pseudogymnoascus destructans 20631-21]|uniref:Major facilitator superfamily (MFS) profile domain-containing protein n=1 Tax=Pseudogymnoascus destructans (strain ATCC MYA-4855 / 20631-21) TaxID=658429 RepID=L8G6J0_PSED2|nr:hypothetical protein GMDG_03091 [Pseudogymnoascus destructans 20631-21]